MLNSQRKKILFIAWDGPFVNYLEGLFIPIFRGLQDEVEIHLIQFSWNDRQRAERLSSICNKYNIKYTHCAVWTRPICVRS